MNLRIATEIGAKVILLRGKEKQEDVARRAKLSRDILSNIENGDKNYTIKSLAQVLEALGGELAPDVDIESFVEKQRELHRQLHKMLQIEGKLSDSIATTINSVYGMYCQLNPAPPHSLEVPSFDDSSGGDRQ